MENRRNAWRDPYRFTLLAIGVFVLFAFAVDRPADILRGLVQIVVSRSVLTTDYIAVGGMGAAFINAALVGLAGLGLLAAAKSAPNGANMMALWLSIGFAFFGKNLLNVAPVTFGVWLYARFQKEPFLNYTLNAILASTLAPVVSEMTFMGRFSPWVEGILGVVLGAAVGFIMPVLSSVATRVHGGYTLYNAGFAGGVVAVFIVALILSFGLEIDRPLLWSSGNNLLLAVFLYLFMAGWMVLGLLGDDRPKALRGLGRIYRHSGRLVTDFYLLYGDSAYLNMGLNGMLGVTVTLVLGADLNGATLAGIFTMMAFGAFGKHLKNCVPVMLGAIVVALFNPPPHTEPSNIIAILFSTGLAPIAGQFGIVWGFVAGFFHMVVHYHLNTVTGGLNLYNNGFSSGFVALALVPLILALRKGRDLRETKI